MAEALNSLFKHELVYQKTSWPSQSALEIATAEWVDWYNTTRLHSSLGYATPTEAELDYYAQLQPEPAPTPAALIPSA